MLALSLSLSYQIEEIVKVQTLVEAHEDAWVK